MSQQPGQPPSHSPAEPPERTAEDVMWGRAQRRRERIRSEIRRNRAGGHRIPTWVLAVLLGLILLGWLFLILAR